MIVVVFYGREKLIFTQWSALPNNIDANLEGKKVSSKPNDSFII